MYIWKTIDTLGCLINKIDFTVFSVVFDKLSSPRNPSFKQVQNCENRNCQAPQRSKLFAIVK